MGGIADAQTVDPLPKVEAKSRQVAGPRIELTTGAVSGTYVQAPRQMRAFLGIPYAAPPIGSLRWQAPQPVGRWSGVRQASQFGPRCMQYASSNGGLRSTEVSEDCLYLNVWAPDSDADEKRPVLVNFHGGNLDCGFR
ncbi:carboxylesterase family protein [Burkholderia ubonensis]|uniref:carboxylesterase family protein n=1 Tax=Burkholderia ubonensis TaxID=101571 RepID=UPI0009B33FF1|nr:carboxylesterase family protein [Burkholderia ubonensis]